ncbi:hypothetical protein [Nocardia sp. MW-W600-9]
MADMKPMSRDEVLRRRHRYADQPPTYHQIAADIRHAMLTAPETGAWRAREQDGLLANRGLAEYHSFHELCGRLEMIVDHLESHGDADTPVPAPSEEPR